MSIQVNLLSNTLNKLFGKGGSGGGNNGMFLHVAWANSGKGEDFTKSNVTEFGDIVPYKLIGLCTTDSEDDEALSFNNYKWTYLCPCGGKSNSDNNEHNGSDNNGGGNGNNPNDNTPNNVVVNRGSCLYEDDVIIKTEGDIVYFLGASDYGYANWSNTWTINFGCWNIRINIWWDLDLCEGPIFFADCASDPWLSLNYQFLNSKLTNLQDKSSGSCIIEEPAPKMTIDNSDVEMYATISNHAIYGKNCTAVFNNIAESFFPSKQSYHITAVRNWESGGNGYLSELSLYDITWEYRWKANSYEDLVAMLPTMVTVTYNDYIMHYDILHDDNPRRGNSLYLADAYGPNDRKQMCRVYADKNNNTADFAGTYVGAYMMDGSNNNYTKVRYRFSTNYSESDLPACINGGGGSSEPEDPNWDTCAVGACDRSTLVDRYGNVWYHAYNSQLKCWVYYTSLSSGNNFVSSVFGQRTGDWSIRFDMNSDPVTKDPYTLSLLRISDGIYVTGIFLYEGVRYYVGLQASDDGTYGHYSFNDDIWLAE